MQRGRVRYRWDRIAGAGAPWCCCVFSLWRGFRPISQSEPELEHPGEAAVVPRSNRLLRFPKSNRNARSLSPRLKRRRKCCRVQQQRRLRPPKIPTQPTSKLRGICPTAFSSKTNRTPRREIARQPRRCNRRSGLPHRPLSHSYAMLLPEVKSLLEDMGHAFADQLAGTKSEGTTFRVTSWTRTARQQARLGRRNYNAIDGGSTHSYGASFDIAYTDRPNNEADCSAPTRAIQHVLKTFQKSGRILGFRRRTACTSRFVLEACAALQVDDFVVGCSCSFHHRLAQCRVRVDGLDELVTGGFQLAQRDQFGDHLRDVGPIMCPPNNSPYFASNTSLTNPSLWPEALALPDAENGNLPTLISCPASLACASVMPTLAPRGSSRCSRGCCRSRWAQACARRSSPRT